MNLGGTRKPVAQGAFEMQSRVWKASMSDSSDSY